MESAIIDIRKLGKAYRLGERGAQTLIARRAEPFWALRDVSFRVARGQVVGVIGRNGAGKSTLLKLLSRITDPSEGSARIVGRIAALLEVGTGFHPDLTGRENIRFNGAILGMTRHEIRRHFDDIVAFADIGPFLDTPVKRYSSGMQVRLAFAVAAHLQPEILLIDEVLAVGDAPFQKKCLGRMRGVAHSGRTVLFVSHNLAAVQQLCDRCIVLERGRLRHDGSVGEGLGVYLEMMKHAAPNADVDCRGLAARSTTPDAEIVRAALFDADGRATPRVAFAAPFELHVTIDVKQPVHDISLGAGVSSLDGVRLFTSESRATLPLARLEAGVHRFRLHWDGLCLRPGLYAIDVGFNADEGRAYLPGVLQLEILEATDGESRAVIDRRPGLVLNTMPWTCDTPVGAEPDKETLCMQR